jgi:hypothetical protein
MIKQNPNNIPKYLRIITELTTLLKKGDIIFSPNLLPKAVLLNPITLRELAPCKVDDSFFFFSLFNFASLIFLLSFFLRVAYLL